MPPLQEIPARNPTRKASPKKTSELSVTSNTKGEISSPALLTDAVEINPAVAETRVMLRTEEEQQAAAREREEKESTDTAKDLNARREARRKSLANRRVSFAPEATLHTWDVVEYMQDSTTSSASTNSTRRASSMSSASLGSPHPQTPGPPGSDPSEPPSTPPEQIEDTVVASPAHQRDLHQKKRRRSSGVPPMNFNNPDDEIFSSSPSSGGSAAGDDDTAGGFMVDDGDDDSDSNSDSDDDGTAMSLDVGDATDMSIKSAASSTGSSARLEEALQLAARQAGTQGIDFDEHGNMGAEEEEEAVVSFQPWSKKGGVQIFSPSQDQENLNPFSPAFKAGLVTHDKEHDEEDGMTMDITRAVGRIMPTQQSDDEMTMDMTVAMGGIIPPAQETSTGSRRKSVAANRRKSTRRRSSGESSSLGDETMDLTMAMGGIQQNQERDDTRSTVMNDEDLTMEFTTVIGGVIANGSAPTMAKDRRRSSVGRRQSTQGKRRSSVKPVQDDETMDMTMAVGGIVSLNSSSKATEATINADMDMDMTRAFGGILPQNVDNDRIPEAQDMMGQEVIAVVARQSPLKAQTTQDSQPKPQPATIASETGSPSLAAFKGKGLRRSGVSRISTTPKSVRRASVAGTPIKTPSTPLKQITPLPNVPKTPDKTTPMRNVEKVAETPTPKASAKKSATPNRLFQMNRTTGAPIPSIVLTPQRRRSSGLGIDRSGLGSPHVAALLDRRGSIGDQAIAFTSGQPGDFTRGVRFDNPQKIEKELDKERQEEKDREDGRKIMEREADAGEVEKDATINLKEMIESLTPKKRPLKGRKSLHVGAAKGILGKRPAELDEDDQDNDEDQGGVKRLKNLQGSPVKNVKLQAPPSKAETTGRMTRAARRSLQDTTGNIITPTIASSPAKGSPITTPKGQGRFRDVEPEGACHPVVPFVEKAPMDNPIVDEEEVGDERMHLQDFLNMTSIRFMELTTTKRRHTIAPTAVKDGFGDVKHNETDADTSLESCVVAGSCTVPMLELFQHVSISTRHLELSRLLLT
jgi:kinetochore protein Spc7/SPC105